MLSYFCWGKNKQRNTIMQLLTLDTFSMTLYSFSKLLSPLLLSE